jgi:hypothetical protein
VIGSRLAHGLIQLGSSPSHGRFGKALRHPERCQRQRLREILKATETAENPNFESYETFSQATAETDYAGISARVVRQRAGEPTLHPRCGRFQPTSGSTHGIKWIPYSREFLSELDAALCPWLSSQASLHPGILQGRHYWSLSWIPEAQRAWIQSSDDREFFPLWKRGLWKLTQAGDPRLAQAPTFEATAFATAVSLAACEDLTFLSVWSPTFALSLIQQLREDWDAVFETLRAGHWALQRSALTAFSAPRCRSSRLDTLREAARCEDRDFLKLLWPHLALVSAWETGASRPWAARLKSLLPHAAFEGKGLWSTEGVVTLPYQEKMPLALTSHFLEFKDLDSGRVHPSWDLTVGQRVQPLLTTGSGLRRYRLEDELKVVDFLEATPCLEFQGRLEGVDLVGEKLSPRLASEVAQAFKQRTGLTLVTLIADPEEAGYSGLVEGSPAGGTLEEAKRTQGERVLEEELCRLFHYELARNLRQLRAARLHVVPDALREYQRLLGTGVIQGNIKVEPLIILKEAVKP